MLGRRNIRPPHFASKVSYSASPQNFVAPYYLAKKRSFFCDFVYQWLAVAPSQRRFTLTRTLVCCGASAEYTGYGAGAENAEYGAGAANAGYSVALQSVPLRLYPFFRAGKKKRLGAERRPAVNIRMYQELLHDNLLAVYDVKTVLSLCNATTAEVINNTVLLCRFDDFCIVDAVGECTSRNQTP